MRIKIILAIFIMIWVGIIVRVFSLSIQSHSYYKKQAQNNTIKIKNIIPIRGEIFDVKNRPIAINKLGFSIKLRPHLRSKKQIDKYNEELDILSKLLPQLDRDKLDKKYKKVDSYYYHDYIELVDFILYDDIIDVYTILNLRENIRISPALKRHYPYGEIASHAIGYVSKVNKKDIVGSKLLKMIGYNGKAGVEKYYNDYLQGNSGKREIKVKSNNEEIKEISSVDAIEDRKLTLNIDMELQKYISSIFNNRAGSIIVMGLDGSILSASSFPEYNLNDFVSGISHIKWNKLIDNPDKPFTNKYTRGLYPPGSTIKPMLGLIYTSNNVHPTWSVTCLNGLPMGKRVFRCWKKSGHRKTSLQKAIRESCDDYFYKGSLKIGINNMSKGFSRFGLGKKTGIDLSHEFIGTVPSRKWKLQKYKRSWYRGETLNTSIGQGNFLVTPLQIANMTALIAKGNYVKPHFAKMIGQDRYKSKFKPAFNPSELSKVKIIRQAMYEVCNHRRGTATKYISSKIPIAGKTGTAQVVSIRQNIKNRIAEKDMKYYNRSHAWLTTYGPYENPQYVVMAMIEHGGHGGNAAGEIVSNIYNKLIEFGYIKIP